MKRSALVALWTLATAVTTAAAFFAVSVAGSQVTSRPLTAVVAAGTAPSIITPESTATSTTSTTLATSTPMATSTTLATVLPSSTTTAVATSAAEWNRTALNSPGGSIIVSYRTGEVRLESAAPRAGFTFEIDDERPERVRVEFLGDETTHTLRAEWTDEGLRTEVDSSGGGDDGD